VFGDAMRLSFWLNGTQSDGCCNFVGGAYYSNEMLGDGMRIAVPAGKRNLVGALNVALRSLQRKGTIAELYLRFFPKSFY
jgi:polar amino acid transport system substrate-binding protein